MNRPRALLLAALCSAALAAPLAAQRPSAAAPATSVAERYRSRADSLTRAALADSAAYERLSLLVDKFGHRFSGSAVARAALDWTLAQMKRDGLENVRGEPVMVPHWVRGAESAELVTPRAARCHARARRQRRHAAGAGSPRRWSWSAASRSCSAAPPR